MRKCSRCRKLFPDDDFLRFRGRLKTPHFNKVCNHCNDKRQANRAKDASRPAPDGMKRCVSCAKAFPEAENKFLGPGSTPSVYKVCPNCRECFAAHKAKARPVQSTEKLCTRCKMVCPDREFTRISRSSSGIHTVYKTCNRCAKEVRPGHKEKMALSLPDGMKRCILCRRIWTQADFIRPDKKGLTHAYKTCNHCAEHKKNWYNARKLAKAQAYGSSLPVRGQRSFSVLINPPRHLATASNEVKRHYPVYTTFPLSGGAKSSQSPLSATAASWCLPYRTIRMAGSNTLYGMASKAISACRKMRFF